MGANTGFIDEKKAGNKSFTVVTYFARNSRYALSITIE